MSEYKSRGDHTDQEIQDALDGVPGTIRSAKGNENYVYNPSFYGEESDGTFTFSDHRNRQRVSGTTEAYYLEGPDGRGLINVAGIQIPQEWLTQVAWEGFMAFAGWVWRRQYGADHRLGLAARSVGGRDYPLLLDAGAVEQPTCPVATKGPLSGCVEDTEPENIRVSI
ncbi:hypothetical protein Dda_0990 [Drechslerella dactyloides]|uniref:Uncharacterized protein n=1 Tax=Drechslerella dactyloides TaxID=74499 RepID=A0AAD6J8F3_DREDA|nr:hypothetical protein Dda_0990 [Drechslerella dactyloides]